MIGRSAIPAIIAPVIAPPAESPTNTSAPTSASVMVRMGVSRAKRALYGSIATVRPSYTTPWRSLIVMFSRVTPSRT